MSIAAVSAGDTIAADDVNTIKNHLEGQAGSTLAWFLRAASGENIVIRLADNAGAKKFSIQDSDGSEIAMVDSDGALTISSTFTPGTLILPQGSAPTPTVEGDIQWDTDDDVIVVGTGSTQKRIGSGTLKTSGGGYFFLPTGPAVGTIVQSSASANTYGSWVEFDASTAAALYVVGATIGNIDTTNSGYVQLDVGTGSTTSVGEWKWDYASSTDAGPLQVEFPFPIPVAASTRIACRTADVEAVANSHLVTLICILQTDLVVI